MRTQKLLITAAAALAAGVISSQAQVYSQNIVGYVNTVLPHNAYSLVENPLNLDSTNTADTVLASSLTSGDNLLLWTGSAFAVYQYLGYGPGFNWQYPDGSYQTSGPAVPPGTGFFYQNGQPTPETNTFVGTVVLTNSVDFAHNAYSVVGSTPPIAGLADDPTTINLPLQGGDNLLVWSNSAFQVYQYLGYGPGFNWQYPDNSYQSTGPTLPVGQAFFYQNGQPTDETWTNSFTVQ